MPVCESKKEEERNEKQIEKPTGNRTLRQDYFITYHVI